MLNFNKKYSIGILFFLLFGFVTYGQEPIVEKIILPDSDMQNIFRIDEGVYRSEQPDKRDFQALEKFGIKEVLNLRRWHSDDDEAKGTSIILHRLKTNAHSISEKELTEALRIIKDRTGPIVIHCKHGSDRTGGVIAMYRIIFQNVSKEAAIQEMKEGGFGFHRIYRNIERTILDTDIESIRKELNL